MNKKVDLSKKLCYTQNIVIDNIINKLNKKFKNIDFIEPITLRIYENIIPNMAVYEKSIIFLEQDKNNIIKWFDVNLNYTKEKLVSVYLDPTNMHPNCNNYFKFCIPKKILYSDPTIKNIDTIIDCIKVYNLDNCYYVPKVLEEYIVKRDNQIKDRTVYYKLRSI